VWDGDKWLTGCSHVKYIKCGDEKEWGFTRREIEEGGKKMKRLSKQRRWEINKIQGLPRGEGGEGDSKEFDSKGSSL